MVANKQLTAEQIAEIWLALPACTDAEAFPHRDQYDAEMLPILYMAATYAASKSSANHERFATFVIEAANFKRRQETKYSIADANTLLSDAEFYFSTTIPNDHPRKNRLLELIGYHLCWGVHYPLGQFAEAVHYAEMMGKHSAKRTARAVRDVAFLRVCAAITDNIDSTQMKKCVEEFECASEAAKAENPSQHEMCNEIYNRLMFSYLGARPWNYQKDTDSLFKFVGLTLSGVVDPHGFGAPALALLSVHSLLNGDSGKALLLAKIGSRIKNHVEALAFTKMLEIEVYYAQNELTLARDTYQDLQTFNDGIGGHLFRIAATRHFPNL